MTKAFIEVGWFVNKDEEKEVEFVNYIVLGKHSEPYQDECELLVDEYLQGFVTNLITNLYWKRILLFTKIIGEK